MFLLDALSLLSLVALLSLGIVFALPRSRLDLLRPWGLSLSVALFFLSLIPLFFSDPSPFFRSLGYHGWLHQWNLHYTVSLDSLSLLFIILSTFLGPVCILCSWESLRYRMKDFLLLLFFTEFCLINVFGAFDLFLFYVFFEAVILPMFFMIGVWGSRLRRIVAAFRFFFYTLAGSLLMLAALVYLHFSAGTLSLYTLYDCQFPLAVQLLLWLGFFVAFAVKVPMMPFHIWLPEAHVEAPTAGSVLLAGILLKLGGYGFLRFSLPLFPEASTLFTPLVFLLSLLGILYGSLITLLQVDLKKIVAYSSVAHMAYVVLGLFSNSLEGMEGAVFLMFSHGLVSSALFLAIGFLYDRHGTRALRYYGGLASLMPLFSSLFLFFAMANLSLPGTSSFIGEFLVLLSLFSVNGVVALGAVVGVALSAAYNVWLFNRLCYGPPPSHIGAYSDLNAREFSLLAFFAVLVICFGLFPSSLLESFHLPLSPLLRP